MMKKTGNHDLGQSNSEKGEQVVRTNTNRWVPPTTVERPKHPPLPEREKESGDKK